MARKIEPACPRDQIKSASLVVREDVVAPATHPAQLRCTLPSPNALWLLCANGRRYKPRRQAVQPVAIHWKRALQRVRYARAGYDAAGYWVREWEHAEDTMWRFAADQRGINFRDTPQAFKDCAGEEAAEMSPP